MNYVYYSMVAGGAYLLLVVLRRIFLKEQPIDQLEEHRPVIWVMLGLLLATMLIGIPILLCIALIGFIGIAAEPGVVMPMFAQKSFAQLDSYTLLALPFFILAGSADDRRRHEPAAGRFLARAGRPPARRPGARLGGAAR